MMYGQQNIKNKYLKSTASFGMKWQIQLKWVFMQVKAISQLVATAVRFCLTLMGCNLTRHFWPTFFPKMGQSRIPKSPCMCRHFNLGTSWPFLHRIWCRYYANTENPIAVLFTFLTLVIRTWRMRELMRRRRQQSHILDPEMRNGKTVAKCTKLQ
jgi:hypothetical protein